MADSKDFKCDVIESSKELTTKERVRVKDTQDALNLNELVQEAKDNGDSGIVIDVDFYVKLHIHNEKATPNQDYDVIVIYDKNGQKFTTGSEAFMRQFDSIWYDMSESDEEWSLKVYGRPSKNYTGRDFITCSVL